MSKDLVCILLLIFLVGVYGCGKKEESIPLIIPKIDKSNFKGVDFVDKKNGISFRYYPEYRKTHRDENGLILSNNNDNNERIVLIVWPFDLDTYTWYKEAFSRPLDLNRRLKKELRVKEEVISYQNLEIEGADVFCFTTKRPSGLFIKRLELFPKKKPLQISLFFWYKKENLQKVFDMIGSIKILDTK